MLVTMPDELTRDPHPTRGRPPKPETPEPYIEPRLHPFPPRHYFLRRPRTPRQPSLNRRRQTDTTRCKFVGLTVTPPEQLVLQAAAQAEGLTLSTWMRKTLLAAVGM